MREAGGRTVLMDFGTGAESGRAARLAGTPLYIAPELLPTARHPEHRPLQRRRAALLPGFGRDSPCRPSPQPISRLAHASGRRKTLRDVRPDLPAAFVRVVDRALSPDPAGRPATAGALEADLTTSLELLTATPAPCAGAAAPARRQICPDGIIALAAALTVAWASGLWTTVTHRSGAPRVRSLAVLPLRNMTGDPDYFTAGMTDLLTTNLSKMKALRVIALELRQGIPGPEPAAARYRQRAQRRRHRPGHRVQGRRSACASPRSWCRPPISHRSGLKPTSGTCAMRSRCRAISPATSRAASTSR